MITGGLGFIGSHLAEDLIKSKHKVILLSKNSSKKNNISNFIDKITLERIDVTHFDKVKSHLIQNLLKIHF